MSAFSGYPSHAVHGVCRGVFKTQCKVEHNWLLQNENPHWFWRLASEIRRCCGSVFCLHFLQVPELGSLTDLGWSQAVIFWPPKIYSIENFLDFILTHLLWHISFSKVPWKYVSCKWSVFKWYQHWKCNIKTFQSCLNKIIILRFWKVQSDLIISFYFLLGVFAFHIRLGNWHLC